VGKENSGQDFFFGFLVGAVAGSVLTLWLSERVRRQLRERGIDVGGRMGGVGAIIRDKADEFLGRVRETVKQAVEEGRKTGDKARSHPEEGFKKESQA